MTVAALPTRATYVDTGSTATLYSIPFQFLVADQVAVSRFVDGVETVLAGFAVTGDGRVTPPSGQVQLTDAVAGATIEIRRVTDRTQPANYTDRQDFPADLHEDTSDREMMAIQEQDADLGRAPMSPRGESGGTLPADADMRGNYLAKDADGNWVPAGGTGADAALRADVAKTTGAALVGTSNGQSVETRLLVVETISNHYRADLARHFPPGVTTGQNAYACWPDVQNTVAVGRYGASGEYFLIRILRGGFVTEIVLIEYPAPNSVVSYEVYSVCTYYQNGFQVWMQQPLYTGSRTDIIFAIRHGLNSDGYSTVSANVSGPGHLRYNVVGAPTIKVNGTGTNLQPIGNMAIGTVLTGTSLVIGPTTFRLLSPAAAENIEIQLTQIFDAANCITDDSFIHALVSNVVITDSPVIMHPALPPLMGGYATHGTFKTTGLEIPLVSDGVQKGNWRKSPLPAAGADTMMWWNSADRTLLYQKRAGVGPFIQNQGGTLTRFQYDQYGLAHLTDDPQSAKLTGYGWTAQQTGPFTAQSFPTGDTHRFVNFTSIDVVPGGPS